MSECLYACGCMGVGVDLCEWVFVCVCAGGDVCLSVDGWCG